jgi:LPXTG-motif cell wall-anchored protein
MRLAVRRPGARRVLVGTITLAGAIALASGLTAPPALAGSTPPPTRPVAAGIGVRLDTVPQNERSDSVDRSYIVRYMRIGTSMRAVITVSNTTKSTQRISVYPAAAVVRHGIFTFLNGAAHNDLTTWTRLSTGQLLLKPDTQAPVTVTVAVPANAYRGQRYAVIWAQVISSKGQITEVSRVGIRMYISVGPGGPPPPGFVIESMTAQRNAGGAPMVVARVRNTGGIALGVTGTLRLTHGPGGTTVGPLPLTDDATVGVGAAVPMEVILSRQVPLGPWMSVLSLNAGFQHRTVRVSLTFPPPQAGNSVPWPLIAGIALAVVLLAIGGYLVVRNRRRAT